MINNIIDTTLAGIRGRHTMLTKVKETHVWQGETGLHTYMRAALECRINMKKPLVFYWIPLYLITLIKQTISTVQVGHCKSALMVKEATLFTSVGRL